MSALLATFGIDWHLLLFNMLNFGVLVAALTYFLYKPVMKMVKERQSVVTKGVEDAEEAAEKLKAAEGTANMRINSAESEAVGIVDAARKSANEEKARIVKEAEARAASVAKDAEARAQEAHAKALRESEKEIARLAVLAAAKALHNK